MPEIETNFSIILTNQAADKLADFTTTFYPPIQLSDSFVYSVGVNKIVFPATFCNVTKGSVQYYSYTENKVLEKSWETGYYGSEEKFIQKFNSILGPDKAFYVIAKDDQRPGHIKIKTNVKEGQLPLLKLSEDLGLLSGLTESPLTTIESQPFNPHFNSECILVKCNIAEHCHLNNHRAPIIEVIPNLNCSKTQLNKLVEYTPFNIKYSNVSQHEIDSIQLSLTSITGETLQFESDNRVICMLSVQCSALP